MIESYSEFRERLARLVDDDYREFSKKGIPTERPFIGVRIPLIREIVKEISPCFCTEFLKTEPVAIEEVLARGMVICELSYEEMMVKRSEINGKSWFDSQVDIIDNRCTCDVFCSGVTKRIKGHLAEVLDQKIDDLLSDSREFAVRVGLVLLKCAYVDFDYLNVIFDRVENLREREEYYIEMASAWLVAECFTKYPEETFAYLKVSKLPKWTYNKTISKICDSYRVAEEDKVVLCKMRK
jgi:3-methyladenine DNA glycosylase AlkD